MPAGIRASYTKVGLRHFKRAHPTQWNALTEAIAPEVLMTVREASNVTFLPAEIHATVGAAMIQTCGRSGARELWREVLVEAFESKLLSPFVFGAIRLFGNAPSSVMRMTPHAWALLFRECGRAWMEPAQGNRAVMRFADLPKVVASSTAIMDSYVANCDAAIAYVQSEGTVTPGALDLGQGTFEITVEWRTTARRSVQST